MKKSEIKNNEIIECYNKKKSSDKEYLKEMQNYLDRIESIENEELKNTLIYKMHRLEKIIERIFSEVLIEKMEK